MLRIKNDHSSFTILTVGFLFALQFCGLHILAQHSVSDLLRLYNANASNHHNNNHLDNSESTNQQDKVNFSRPQQQGSTIYGNPTSYETHQHSGGFPIHNTHPISAGPKTHETFTPTVDNQQLIEIISKNILQFSHEIAIYLGENYEEKTQVFSPLSIAGALSMLFLGSKGVTYSEFMNFLGYNNNEYYHSNPSRIHDVFGELITKVVQQVGENSSAEEKNKVEIANGIFLANKFSLRPTYKDAIESTYDAEIKTLDYVVAEEIAREYINSWVNRKTHQKIKSIFDSPIDPNTKLIIASSLYFLGFWETTFHEKFTRIETFYPNGPENPGVSIDYMASGGFMPYYRSQEHGLEILGIPYKDDEFQMYIIHPKNSTRQRLKQVQRALNADTINEIISKMEMVDVVIGMPKLDIESTIDLKKILTSKGLGSIFSRAYCDLSLISDGESESTPYIFSRSKLNENRNSIYSRRRRQLLNKHFTLQKLEALRRTQLSNPHLYADAIIHKVSLTVNEKGTEGGAATYSSINKSVQAFMRVLSPYMFLIRHESTKTIIFYGTVFEPTQSRSV